ncbi:MAG TPA: PIN domain-containing protein [Terracidiphilus sp.]|jgi:predicted nucleic-acid-binding protein|nr:PIN domain-containing protein [Terracidiphilus sp.]
MLAADTNVWARAYLNDDAVQAAKARSALAQARSEDGVFVPLLVLAELSWVLRGRWERERVLNTIEGLLQTRGVSVESPALARRALDAARKGRVGFADHLIAEVALKFGASEIITFDRDFGRKQHVRRLK